MNRFFNSPRLRTLIDLLILFSISLLPFRWLGKEQIIFGHDAGLTLQPIPHFIDRFYLWTQRFGFGADQAYAIPGFFIHGLEALISFMGFSLQRSQEIVFFFWMFLPALTMYYATRSLFRNRRYLPLFASLLFAINHFLLQGWFVAERTKFSIYAALPLIFLFIFRMFNGTVSPVTSGLLTGLTLFILNGGGSLPLYGSVFVLVLLSILYFIFLDVNTLNFKRAIIYVTVSVFATVLLSSFWLIPFAYYVFYQFSVELARTGGIDGVLGWAKVISEHTSFLNLMRLQGIPDWYGNPFHPYANVFLKQPLFLAVSFLIPVVAFSSFFLLREVKEKILIFFFFLVSLVGMFFAAGLHPPTGFLYELMIRFVPGFLAFRTPFYKFGPLIWFSFSLLIAFTIDEFLARTERLGFLRRFRLPYLLFVCIIIGILIYNFPFLDGRFFDYDKGRTTRVNIPAYLFDLQRWTESKENTYAKSLLFPALREDNKLQTYRWGYFSLTSLTALLSRSMLIENGFYVTKDEDALLRSIYENILNNEEGWEKLVRNIGIKNFIVRGDYKWEQLGMTTRNPEEYDKTLKNSSFLELSRVFGPWKIYSFIDDSINPLIFASYNVSYTETELPFIRYLSAIPDFDYRNPMYFEDQNKTYKKNAKFFLARANDVYLLPRCIGCALAGFPIDVDPRGPLLLPGSPLYSIVVDRERKLRENEKDFYKKIDFLLTTSLRRVREAKRMVDLKVNLESLEQPIREHFALLVELDSILSDISDFDMEEGNDLLILIESYMDYQRSRLDEIFNRSGLEEEITNNSYRKLLDITNKVKSWSWRTRTEDDKRYMITTESPGEYNLWLMRDRLELPADIEPSKILFKFTIDGIFYQQNPERIDGNWILIRKVLLGKGVHRVTFALEKRELFSGAIDSQEGSLPDFLTQNNGVYIVRAQGDKNCVTYKVANLESGHPYRVSFKHRRIQGDQNLRVLVSQKKETIEPLTRLGDVLVGEANWRDFQMDKKLVESDTFFILICTNPYRDPIYTQNTLIEIRDISVRKLSSPVFVFEKVKAIKADRESIKASFNRINQTRYSVKIQDAKGPFFITFSQRFSPDWKIYIDDGRSSETFGIAHLLRKEYPEKYHFIGNGFANSWYIDTQSGFSKKTGDISFIIEYKPQLLLYVSALISLISLITILGILLRRRFSAL